MKTVYALALIVGILSVPAFFLLLIPISISQLSARETSEAFNLVAYALCGIIVSVIGCIVIVRTAKGIAPFSLTWLVVLQILCGLFLFSLATAIRKQILNAMPSSSLQNSSGGDTFIKQEVEWLSILLPIALQFVIFWLLVKRGIFDK